jgi:hypothetical protein
VVGFTKNYPCGAGKFKDIIGVFSSVSLYRGILTAGFYCNIKRRLKTLIMGIASVIIIYNSTPLFYQLSS